MPELPDIELYVDALRERVVGRMLLGIRLANPFLLRTVSPTPKECADRKVCAVSRIGKRIVLELADDLFAVMHLMIAGRLHWRDAGSAIPKRLGLVAFDLAEGSLILTEAGTKRRASLHLVRGAEGLDAFRRGGLDLRAVARSTFAERLRLENHTLKRALTDPRLFDGIGNAYSDEILHAAGLSPMLLTRRMTEAQIEALHGAAIATLATWAERLRAQSGAGFPEKVTAFRPEMAVHGRYRKPCPRCGTEIQRIAYADNECDYCPRCQTGGRLLADRALSRLLREDWPRTIDELEQIKSSR